MRLNAPYIRMDDVPAEFAENFMAVLKEDDWYVLDYRKNMVGNYGQSSYDSIVFRHSYKYSSDSIEDMPLYEKFKDVLQPYIDWLEERFDMTDYVALAARLGPKHKVAMHQDGGEFLETIHRIHFPILTNDDAFYRFANGEIQMPLNSAFEIDNIRDHGVRNDGDTPRIHLIINVYGDYKQ